MVGNVIAIWDEPFSSLFLCRQQYFGIPLVGYVLCLKGKWLRVAERQEDIRLTIVSQKAVQAAAGKGSVESAVRDIAFVIR